MNKHLPFDLKANLLDDNKIIKKKYVIGDYVASGISIRKDLKKRLMKFSSETQTSSYKILENFALTLMQMINTSEIKEVERPQTRYSEYNKVNKHITTSFLMREKDFERFTNFCRKLRISRSFAISYCINRYIPE